MAKKIGLTKRVEYRDSSGFKKAAVVIGTEDSVQPGTDVEVPKPGTAHLKVFSLKGADYVRLHVPLGEGPRTFSLLGRAAELVG